MTAPETGRPSACSAIAFISFSTNAEISGSENSSSRILMRTPWFSPGTISYLQTARALRTSSLKK